ncbi:MAG: hypothetical protein EPO22_14380 [Dehalococcoidia bacterium]|nr:MAG: hypothetical protein EPO22_14380 [Dehalococcoidia bacterium]
MSDRDYYELLGLTPRADGAMVDQAYWHLARKYQMLAVTNPRARIMLDELNEAYGVLGNPRLREQYDAFRDDVLIRKGMIRPVVSRPKTPPAPPAKRTAPASPSDRPAARRMALPSVAVKLPKLGRDEWRSLGVGGVILALALAGAWQGVNALFVIGALVVGLAMALTPVLKRQLADVNLSLPAVSIPHLEMPKLPEIGVQRLRDVVAVPKDEPAGPEEIRQSTAAMISRWRNSVGLVPEAPGDAAERKPSTKLVEIVETERKLHESDDEPLAAVMDILRGSGANSVRTGDRT